MISEGTVEDAPGLVALANAVHDDRLITLAGMRHQFATTTPETRYAYWKAERDGVLVGWGFAGFELFAATPGRAVGSVIVHPEYRRQGIGSALWERLEAHWSDLGAHHLVVESRADPASREFVAGRGFAQTSASEMLALAPRALPPPLPPPAGLELVPCAAYADDPAALYAVDYEIAQDEPTDHDHSGLTFDLWYTVLFRHPNFDAETSLVARVDGEPVGMTLVYADLATGRAVNGGTGVLRTHRNRGIATVMKRHALARAADAGITRVITRNDATNAPMLAINRRLGYERFSAQHGWTRTA